MSREEELKKEKKLKELIVKMKEKRYTIWFEPLHRTLLNVSEERLRKIKEIFIDKGTLELSDKKKRPYILINLGLQESISWVEEK